jgi:hypothetical protein
LVGDDDVGIILNQVDDYVGGFSKVCERFSRSICNELFEAIVFSVDCLSRCFEFAEGHMRRPPGMDDREFGIGCYGHSRLKGTQGAFRAIESNQNSPVGARCCLLDHEDRTIAEADYAFGRGTGE